MDRPVWCAQVRIPGGSRQRWERGSGCGRGRNRWSLAPTTAISVGVRGLADQRWWVVGVAAHRASGGELAAPVHATIAPGEGTSSLERPASTSTWRLSFDMNGRCPRQMSFRSAIWPRARDWKAVFTALRLVTCPCSRTRLPNCAGRQRAAAPGLATAHHGLRPGLPSAHGGPAPSRAQTIVKSHSAASHDCDSTSVPPPARSPRRHARIPRRPDHQQVPRAQHQSSPQDSDPLPTAHTRQMGGGHA